MAKLKEKTKAIKLRKKGLSYSEILKKIPVAKSTLSLWLRSVGLSKTQKQRLTKKKLVAALRGSEVKKKQRLLITKEIRDKARKDIKKLSERELWLIGIVFYWAEGSKQKEHNVSQVVEFSNSDPRAIRIFIKWLLNICKLPKQDIQFRIYLHENNKERLDDVQKYWSKITQFSIKNFQKITWKKHKINTNRKNIGKKYFGVLTVKVKKSTNLNRKIEGWIQGIDKNCRVV
jgi:transcriptional regulator with XRE-family HTH domain